MTTPRVPSAEELMIDLIDTFWRMDQQTYKGPTDRIGLVTAYRNVVLEAAAQIADDEGAPYIADCIRNLTEDL